MDPISQAAAGAAFAQTPTAKHALKKAGFIGALAGMAPDLDVFIRSSKDPLLALEFHRHFTHSLFFIPIGALICALVFYGLLRHRWNLQFAQIYVWSFLGYASHGILDSCTTYGTQLLWPFSDERIAWNNISVVDPLFTLPLLFCLTLAMMRSSKIWHALGITWALLYLFLGWWQSERAENIGHQIARNLGHSPVELEAKPSFGNIIVWKVIYEYQGTYYVNAVRPGLTRSKSWQGQNMKQLDIRKDFPKLIASGKLSQQIEDIERFTHFSSGYVGVDPTQPNRIIDVRYSLLPHHINGLWGIEVDPNAQENEHVKYVVMRENANEAFGQLLDMILSNQ